jgi:hypothetical protein
MSLRDGAGSHGRGPAGHGLQIGVHE